MSWKIGLQPKRKWNGASAVEHVRWQERAGPRALRVCAGSGSLCEQIAYFFQKHLGLRRRRRWAIRCAGLLQSVDGLDGQEQHQCDDEKIEGRLQEGSIADQYLLAGGILAQGGCEIREVHSADQLAQHRHE